MTSFNSSKLVFADDYCEKTDIVQHRGLSRTSLLGISPHIFEDAMTEINHPFALAADPLGILLNLHTARINSTECEQARSPEFPILDFCQHISHFVASFWEQLLSSQ
jgi:hypothetical protein